MSAEPTKAIVVTDQALLDALPPLPEGEWGPILWGEPNATKQGLWFFGGRNKWGPILPGLGATGLHCYNAVQPEPVKRVVWLNLYPKNLQAGEMYVSRSDADSCAFSDRIACIRVEFTERQFDTDPDTTEPQTGA